MPKSTRDMSASLAGWLSPCGQFYICQRFGHNDLAEALGTTSRQLEERGWIRITPSPGGDFDICVGDRPPTTRQLNAVWAWCIAHNRTYPRQLLEDAAHWFTSFKEE